MIHVGNQLKDSKSPYLRSASEQPVNWQLWTNEAFEKAKREDKPVLLDIGAVWCHWCHVIDRESYENPEIATLINANFIPIKVDRDQRPDIDVRYQRAVSALTGTGGWPLTAFLTPEGELFFGGTYFPPESKWGMTGFKELLPRLAQIYKEKREDVMKSAAALREDLEKIGEARSQEGELSFQVVTSIAESAASNFEPIHGGFGAAPKFPNATALELCLYQYELTQQEGWLGIVTKTLDGMGHGGMYDQIGGGFHRYSVDKEWHVPHFEKMSHVNAELLKAYVHGFQATQKPLYREVAEGILRYTIEIGSDPKGGFYATQDADVSLDDDGSYFTWTAAELKQILTQEEIDLIFPHFGIRELPQDLHTLPDRNVLYISEPLEQIASRTGRPPESIRSLLESATEKMRRERAKRKTPYIDESLYANWNGLMISAFLEAYQAFRKEIYLETALKAVDRFLKEGRLEGGGVQHLLGGPAEGYLDDQAQMAYAALDAYEVTGERRYLEAAQKVMASMRELFYDEVSGGFFDRKENETDIGLLRTPHKSIEDNPSASANATALLVLDRLALLTKNDTYRRMAENSLKAFAKTAKAYGMYSSTYALALGYHLKMPIKIVLIGDKGDERFQKLLEVSYQSFRSGKWVETHDPKEAALPFPKDPDGKPLAYVCAGTACAPPVHTPVQLKELLTNWRP